MFLTILILIYLMQKLTQTKEHGYFDYEFSIFFFPAFASGRNDLQNTKLLKENITYHLQAYHA